MKRNRVQLGASVGFAIVATAISAPAVAGLIPHGDEFQVNNFTFQGQGSPRVAAAGDGSFVVVWRGVGEFPNNNLFARRFDALGTPLGLQVNVSPNLALPGSFPLVGADGLGAFVVVFPSLYDGDGDNSGVFAQRLSSSGVRLGAELQVNAYTLGSQFPTSIAMSSDGDFVVVWGSAYQDGGNGGVFGRRFFSSGMALGGEFQVNTHTLGDQIGPAIALRADGGFVVVWSDQTQDGSFGGIFGHRYDASGAKVGSDFQVNGYTPGGQYRPTIAMDGSDGFVVVWLTYDSSGVPGVVGHRFDSSAARLGTEFQINLHPPYLQPAPMVARHASGEFLVTWSSYRTGDFGVFARRFSAAGAAIGAELQVNTYDVGRQYDASVASNQEGFLVVWRSDSQDGDSAGVFAQLFQPGLTLDVDGNEAITPLTDGLLILRYQFGFRGAVLIAGAIGAGCTRCTAAEIEAFLAGI